LLADVLASAPVPLTAAELAAVRTLTGDTTALADAECVDEVPVLPFVFNELDANAATDIDELDQVVVAALEPHAQAVTAVWRSWRYLDLDLLTADADESDGDEAPGEADETAVAQEEGGWGPLAPLTRAIDAMPDPLMPYRVYLVQVEDPALTQPLAADLLHAVPDSANAGVEIVPFDGELPPYQRAALSGGLLLWADDGPEFTMARVFDFADPVTGPGFEPDHPVIDDPAERAGVLEYLNNGFPVLISLAMMDDILDPEAGPAVPTSFRTDGVWIWQDPISYYLERHSIAPAADLTEHIRQQLSAGITVPDTDEETANRAADFILQPPADDAGAAVWFPGSRPG
jgi:hypothetical protein